MEDTEEVDLINELTIASRKMIDPTNVDTKSRIYWQKIFKTMDEYCSIPLHKRESVLAKVFNNDEILLQRLRTMYDVQEHTDIVDYDKLMTHVKKPPNPEKQRTPESIMTNIDQTTTCPLKTAPPRRRYSLIHKLPSSETDITRQENIDYRKELTTTKQDDNIAADSMYINFLKKPIEKANRWRPKPPVTLKGMSLEAKCDAITREIATNFVEWMNNLGGESKSALDVAGLESLFEIGFSCHAADSIMVQLQELNAVTESIARARQTPEASYSTQLYRQLFRDMSAVKSKEANFAFGTMLPPEMRAGTRQDSSVSKWLENKRVPEKLASMAVVWEGIEALKSTEGYCGWLQEHSEITPPSYLVSKGLMRTETKKGGEATQDKSEISVRTSSAKSPSAMDM